MHLFSSCSSNNLNISYHVIIFTPCLLFLWFLIECDPDFYEVLYLTFKSSIHKSLSKCKISFLLTCLPFPGSILSWLLFLSPDMSSSFYEVFYLSCNSSFHKSLFFILLHFPNLSPNSQVQSFLAVFLFSCHVI